MKGWIVLGVLVVGAAGIGAWYSTSVQPVSDAKDAYEQWAEQRLRDRFDGHFDVRGRGSETSIGGEGGRRVHIQSLQERSTLHSSVFRYDDARLSGDQVEIDARQVVHFDPPGVISAYGAETQVLRHHVTLVRSDAGWQVQDFDEEADG